MDMQFELFGGAPPQDEPAQRSLDHRYYFTLVPPPAVAQDIERGAMLLARRVGARNLVRADRLHVSLHCVQQGREITQDLLDEALEAGGAVRRPGFTVSFDQVLSLSGNRAGTGGRRQFPTVLTCSNGAHDLLGLYGDIRQQLQRLGLPVGPRKVVPHLTIWYCSERLPETPLRRAYRWPVRAFWLVHTMPGMRRPDYLGEWVLG